MADPQTPPVTERASGDSAFEASAFEHMLAGGDPGRWLGWRRRALVLMALLGCIGALWMARWLAATPYLAAEWRNDGSGALVLASSALPQLHAHRGRSVVAVSGGGASPLAVDAALLHGSPRWQVNDAQRTNQMAQHEGLAALVEAGPLSLHFADGTQATVDPTPRGWRGLGWLYWPLTALALLLLLAGTSLPLARPRPINLLYAMMALCLAGNLLFIALETMPGLGAPMGAQAGELLARIALDGCTGAAAVTALALHPRRLPGAGWIAAGAWGAALGWLALTWAGMLAPLWWWVQGLCLGFAAAALALAAASLRAEPNPHAMILRRFAAATLATLLLVTAAVALAASMPEVSHDVAVGAVIAWHVFLASLLLLAPFLVRGPQLLREFALLAGVGTVAASLDLLFKAVFALGTIGALALALSIAAAVYAGTRRWLLTHTGGSSALTTERIFDLLYRAAREVQARPSRYPLLLKRLLRDLFEPLEVLRVDRMPASTRIVGGGSGLVAPVRGDDDGLPVGALLLRHAGQGRRLFTLEDARLVDRVIDQLRRAVAYDQAVERGRHEERLRIAQDLHDDIGARLLTLMYQAPTPEMENYLRHTLQDLKTLTRGLAAAEHRLSHAAVEWKADLAHRLDAAQAELAWSFHCDRDPRLTVVQWSALTRVLRELVSNSLYHGHASRVAVQFSLEAGQLLLQVADDGQGREPQAWAHGLGLGGVRKRVKLLGGTVLWRENVAQGIVCEVRLSGFGDAA